MAGLFDNIFGGGAGSMFGGNSLYADMLTPQQMDAIRKQSMMQVAAKLLESSGPSTTRRTLGQTLGGALTAGAEAMQTGQTNAVQQLLVKQKLDEAKATAARRANLSKILGGGGESLEAPAMPSAQSAAPALQTPMLDVSLPATAAPVPALNPQQQALAKAPASTVAQPTANPATAMPAPAAVAPRPAPMNLQQFVASQPQSWRESLALMPEDEAFKAIQDRQVQASTYGKPEFFVGQDNKPVAIQYNALGESREVPGLRPSEPTPNEIKTLRELGIPVTLAGVIQLRQAGAANVNVGGSKLNLTPAQEAIDKKFADSYLEWQSGGGADAAANIAQISTVLEQLEQGKPLTGPMIGVQPDLLLNLTNPNAANAKEQVQEVVQRNLRVVLGAQFTAAEGNQLISRAFNPNLTPQQNAARLRKLFQQMSVAAQQKQAMSEYYETNGTLKGYKGKQPNINDFYKALEVRPAPKAGDVVGGWRFKGGNPNDEANYEKVR